MWCHRLHHVAPRGTTWHHCCTTVVPRCTTVVPLVMPLWHNKEKILHQWCYNGTTGSATWHHRSATVVPSGATWCNRWHHIAPPVVPLFFYACRPYNRVRTGWCNQILVWSVEQTMNDSEKLIQTKQNWLCNIQEWTSVHTGPAELKKNKLT